MALPLGELSPKVTERALQALPISSGRCSNGTHLRLVIARSEATWQSQVGTCDFAGGFLMFRLHTARLPRPLRGLAMTRRGACRIRRGAGTNSQAPPSRVIAGSKAPMALPLGELSPKVTERALQALPISSGRCSNGTHLRLVIARSEASLALPLGELSPKVTERALQALLNGNSNQGEG